MLILKTKIERPQLQQVRLLERPKLLHQLFGDNTHRLVLIQAAAGYGKTTVMVQQSEQLEIRHLTVGWLTLDNDDNDPIRLYQYLWTILTQKSDAQLLVEDRVTKSHIHHLLSQLNTTTSHTLFIDELEVLTNPDSLNIIWWLYLFLPSNYHLVIASRALPNWALAKGELQGLVHIIRAHELRLSALDAHILQQYLHSNLIQNTTLTPYMAANQSLSEMTVDADSTLTLIDNELVSMLIDKTEGWLTGIQLINLCCTNEKDLYQLVHQMSGAQRQIADFLAEQVFLQCDAHVQNLLLNISVLRKINASLCHALTGATDAQVLLKNLSQQGLFIQAIDDQYQWFRIHQLMRQFLQTRLQNQAPEKYFATHSKAADWYQTNSMFLEVIYHAQLIGDNTLILSALTAVSHDLILEGRLYSLLELTESLTDSQLCQHPALLYDLIWGLILSRQHYKAARYIKVLEQEELYLLDNDNQTFISHKDKQLGLSAMTAFIADDLPKSYQLAQIGLQQLSLEAYFFRAPLLAICALYQLNNGNIRHAHSLIFQSRTLYIKDDNPYGLTYIDSIDATCDRLLGDIPSATKKFQRIGISPDYAQLGTNDSNRDMMLSVASSLKASFYYECNRIEDARQALRDFDQGENMVITDMITLGFLTELKLACLAGMEISDQDLSKANNKADEWSLPRLTSDIQRWVDEQDLKKIMPVMVTGKYDDKNDRLGYQIKKRAKREDGELSDLTLTELLTGLDFLPYRTAIFLGNGQQVAQAVVELNQLLKADLPFVIRNARIRLLLAMAYHVLDQPILSYKSLLDALEQFKSTQTHRIILDEHPLILVLLSKLCQYQGNEVAVSSDIQRYIVSILEIEGRDFYGEGSFSLKDKQSQIESAMQLSSNSQSDPNSMIVLSEREIEILLLVERGLSDGQIADKIFLSIHTVKWHLRNIYHKLQVRSRTQAVAQAHQQYILK